MFLIRYFWSFFDIFDKMFSIFFIFLIRYLRSFFDVFDNIFFTLSPILSLISSILILPLIHCNKKFLWILLDWNRKLLWVHKLYIKLDYSKNLCCIIFLITEFLIKSENLRQFIKNSVKYFPCRSSIFSNFLWNSKIRKSDIICEKFL